MHPEAFSYPNGGKDVAALGLSAIGVCRDGDGQWVPLALDDGRNPYAVVGGQAVPLDADVLGPAIYQALDEACERLWGNSWNSSVGEVFRVNRRTTQRDRVSRNLLPPRILQVISYIASADDGQELAAAMLALARYDRKLKGNKEIARRYWMNAFDLYYGDADHEVGVSV